MRRELIGLNSSKTMDFLGFSYLKKWIIIGLLIGVVAGFGSIAFFKSLEMVSQVFLEYGAGYQINGSESSVFSPIVERPWLFPIITGGGGLAVGLIVSRFAPEASGHGTDAVIDAFHNKKGRIRSRIPLVKAISSIITIGTGGSGGREGPTAQIGAGFGSILSRLFQLNTEDRRIAIAAGLGAGIGSIFKAPLGAALLSTEIFYRRDFEVKALLPALIASVTGFAIFGSFFGWSPVFTIDSSAIEFNQPLSLVLYAIVGACCAGGGLLFVKTFYFIQKIFRNLSVPVFVKPAIGGTLVGIIAMFLPPVMGPGYDWLQIGIFDNPNFFPLWILIALFFLKMVSTSLSIGSGGSAGVFGPGLVMGGFLGAIIGFVFHSFNLFLDVQLATISIVSMVAFFAAISKAPISTIIIGSEMTGGYTLLPAMVIATVVAYAIIGLETTIYGSQVKERSESPAHKKEYQNPLLKKLLIKDALNTDYNKTTGDTTVGDAIQKFKHSESRMLVVVSDTRKYVGVLDLDNVQRLSDSTVLSASKKLPVVRISHSLYDAIKLLSSTGNTTLPVVDEDNTVLGTISLSDIMRVYDIELDSLFYDEDERLSGSTKNS